MSVTAYRAFGGAKESEYRAGCDMILPSVRQSRYPGWQRLDNLCVGSVGREIDKSQSKHTGLTWADRITRVPQ